MRTLQDYIVDITIFINDIIIPSLFALALLFFVWNAVKYMIIGAGDKNAQENARNLALYGIGAFVFLVSLWGIVNLLVYGLGFGGDTSSVRPDYLENDRFFQENAKQDDYCWSHPNSLDCQ